MNPADTRGQTDVLLGAITKEKASFAHLAAAAQACRDADAKRLYNRLALDGLEHLLTLVARMGSLADDWLARLDLTLPAPNLPDPLPVSEDAILRSTMQEEVRPQNRCSRLSPGVDREELLALLESLRVEEEEPFAASIPWCICTERRCSCDQGG
jgi:hypothetical protein